MPELSAPVRRFVPLRWVVPALLLLAGVLLFLWYAPDMDPVATPPALENLP